MDPLRDSAGDRPVLCVALVALAVLFFAMWAGIGVRDDPGDLILYFDYANHVDDGHVPYRDFSIEYPPLALLPIEAAFSSGQSFDAFEAAFAVETYLCAAAMLVLVWRFMPVALPAAGNGERRLRLAAFVAAFPLLGQIVTTRLDPVPTLLMLLALALWLLPQPHSTRIELAAWAALAAGVAMKLFPAVIAPLFALDLLTRRGAGAAARGSVWFAALSAIFFLPALLVSPSGLWHVFAYHADRGVQIESLWSNGLLILNHLTGFRVGTDHVFGAFEAISAWTDEIKPLSTLLQASLVAGICVWWGALSRFVKVGASISLLNAATLTLAAFILAGKVFSPQYLIWLMPLVVLLPGRAGRVAIGTFLLTLALSQALFPYAYRHLLDRDDLGVTLLTVRNLAYIATVAATAVAVVGHARRAAIVPVAQQPAAELVLPDVVDRRSRA